MKVVFLDTRSFRDDHYIPSVGGWEKFPLAPLFAAFSRLSVKLLGVGSKYAGEILGEEQWTWLEKELLHSTSSLNVVVSSIQILTTNPLVESWGHFPVEKRRLVSLLSSPAINSMSVVLLSGDVHHAEFSHAGDILEVTSSGLTHSCSGPFYGFVCTIMLETFPAHRWGGFFYPHEVSLVAEQTSAGAVSYSLRSSLSQNFGLLHVEMDGSAKIQIIGADGQIKGEILVSPRNGTNSIDWDRDVPPLLDGKASMYFLSVVMSAVLILLILLRKTWIKIGGRWRSRARNNRKKKD